jgi:hypothetical protein
MLRKEELEKQVVDAKQATAMQANVFTVVFKKSLFCELLELIRIPL